MSFRLVPKSVTLNGIMALFCDVSANSCSFQVHCVKVHVHYLISWWVLVLTYYCSKLLKLCYILFFTAVPLSVCVAARRTMPFRLSELSQMSLTLRDVCLGIISLTHPDTRPVSPSTRLHATQQLDVLAYVFRVCHSISSLHPHTSHPLILLNRGRF